MSVLSDPQRFRKLVAGAALIGFPVAGLASCLTDSAEGTGQSGSELAKYVSDNASGIHTSGLIFMLSAVLTVPAALGVAHLLRHRGSTLGHIGAACLIIGAFGHFAYGFWQVLISQAQGLDVVTYLGRMSSQSNLLLPEMILVDVGVLLLSIGLVRSRAVPSWAPWATIAGVGLDVIVQFSGISATWPVTAIWGLLVVTWGYIGVRVLRMERAAWASFDLAAVPTPQVREMANLA
jgi:hypothetical protein